MKAYLILYLFIFYSLFSCQESKAHNASTPAIENDVAQDSLELSTIQKEESYRFGYNFIDNFKIGYPIQPIQDDKRFIVRKEVKTFEEEGYSEEKSYLVVSDKQGKLFEVLYEEKPEATIAKEFIICSNRLQDKKEIGVGKTIQHFFKIYPNAKIFYSYLGDGNIWLESGYQGVQYIIEVPTDFLNDIKIDSDLMEFELSQFSGNEEITSVRIHGAPQIENLNGIWSTPDNTVTAAFTRVQDTYHIELSTGNDIYNQFSQDLIIYYNTVVSTPSEETKIEIYTYDYPNSIELILDDHSEFEPMRVKLFPKQKYNLK